MKVTTLQNITLKRIALTSITPRTGRELLAVALSAVVMAMSGSAVAQPPRPGYGFERIIERLDLDRDTQAAVRAIIDESRQEGRALRDEVRQAEDRLNELLSQETPDEAAVLAQAESLGNLETQMTKHRLTTLLRIRALLTPEQRTELKEIRRRHRGSILETCREEVDALCADAEDPRDTIRCLRRRTADLSDDCLQALPPRGHRHRRGPGRF